MIGMVILAAGTGKRMGASGNKLFLPLAGQPVLSLTLRHAARALPGVPMMLVCRSGEEELARQAVVTAGLDEASVIVTEGGPERQDSVRLALAAMPSTWRSASPRASARRATTCISTRPRTSSSWCWTTPPRSAWRSMRRSASGSARPTAAPWCASPRAGPPGRKPWTSCWRCCKRPKPKAAAMPDLIDRALRAAERPPVALLHAPRCLTARDASARCTACADACPVDALAVTPLVAEGAQPYESVNPTGKAGPRIDDEACVRCGACVTACPTNALLPLPPLDDEALFARAASAAARAAERAVEQAAENASRGTAMDETTGKSAALNGRAFENAVEDAAGALGCDANDAAHGAAGENAPAVEGPAPATAGLVCERWAQTRRLDGDRTVVLPCLGWVDAPLLVHMACNGAERIVLPLEACAACALPACCGSRTERCAAASVPRTTPTWPPSPASSAAADIRPRLDLPFTTICAGP